MTEAQAAILQLLSLPDPDDIAGRRGHVRRCDGDDVNRQAIKRELTEAYVATHQMGWRDDSAVLGKKAS